MYALVSAVPPRRKPSKCAKTIKQDLRNHGGSPHDARHDYITMAEDVSAFICEHDLKETTLIGHSMYVTDGFLAKVAKTD